MDFSVVIPVFNEVSVLPELCSRLKTILDGEESLGEYEIVFVNDGSSDGSLECLREQKKSFTQIKIVNLSRNFGHQLAITAGLDHADGEAIAFMDADLQDPPEVLLDMLKSFAKDMMLSMVSGHSAKEKIGLN